jgi:hypothetical protein
VAASICGFFQRRGVPNAQPLSPYGLASKRKCLQICDWGGSESGNGQSHEYDSGRARFCFALSSKRAFDPHENIHDSVFDISLSFVLFSPFVEPLDIHATWIFFNSHGLTVLPGS